MRRSWGLTIFTLLVALAFVSGCAKKTVLKEEVMPKESTAPEVAKPVVKAPEKSVLKDDGAAKRRAELERAAAEEAKEKAAKLKAAKEAAAVSSKELYELVDIYFDFDKFNLQDKARAILNKHAEWLNKNKDVKITIEGHCDERGTAEYNLALGERRANAVIKFLFDMGIDGKRIKGISYGSEIPLDQRHNEEAWAKNRRAHFIVSLK
jgi:peptidoglycan-associated lipoprotein